MTDFCLLHSHASQILVVPTDLPYEQQRQCSGWRWEDADHQFLRSGASLIHDCAPRESLPPELIDAHKTLSCPPERHVPPTRLVVEWQLQVSLIVCHEEGQEELPR